MSDKISKQILAVATEIIHTDRQESYGTAEESFERIGKLWSIYLSTAVSAHDVAVMMVLLKISRALTDHKLDTYVDMAGYAALAGRLA